MKGMDAESRLRAYMPIVEAEAYRRSVVRMDWRDDLRSAGMVALWRVCQSFDDSRGVKFGTFAARAVRNAIFDEIRKLEVSPRSVVRWRRLRNSVEADLMQRLMRTPTENEIEAALKPLVGPVRRNQSWGFRSTYSVISLEHPISHGDGKATTVADFVADGGPIPGDGLSVGDVADELERLMASMKPRDRLIFRMRFWEGKSQDEIGKAVGLTGAMISLILTKHCRKMGKKLKHAA